MNDSIHYSQCPVCSSSGLKKVLTVKDHTVSGQLFDIMECLDCTLRFTQDVPNAAAIGPYYKAEDYISHTETSKGLINKLYKFVRKRTLRKKKRLVEKYTRMTTGRFLDLGSGTGAFVKEMSDGGWAATGLEPDPGARMTGKQLYGVDLHDTSEFYNLPASSFNAITLWHVLEHVHDLHGYIQQLHAILEKKGKIFIAVPNYTSLDAATYKEYWAAYDVPRHLYHFSPLALKRLIEAHGLSIVAYKPMWYDSFYISLLSSKYKSGSAGWVAACWNGLRSNIVALADTKKCSSVVYVIERADENR